MRGPDISTTLSQKESHSYRERIVSLTARTQGVDGRAKSTAASLFHARLLCTGEPRISRAVSLLRTGRERQGVGVRGRGADTPLSLPVRLEASPQLEERSLSVLEARGPRCGNLRTLLLMQFAGTPNLWPGTKACKPLRMLSTDRETEMLPDTLMIDHRPTARQDEAEYLSRLFDGEGWPSKSDPGSPRQVGKVVSPFELLRRT